MTVRTNDSTDVQNSAGPRLVIAGTFVLDPLTEGVTRLLTAALPGMTVAQAPYGQLVELLYDPTGPLLTGEGVNILVIRPEDLLRGPDDARLAVSDGAARLADEIRRGLSRAPQSGRATWLTAIPPASPRLTAHPEASAWVAEFTESLTTLVRRTPGLQLADLASLAEVREGGTVHDEYGDSIAHLPYSDEYLAALGARLARWAASAWVKPRKLVVLDCDNTLWAGVCGEDGPKGVAITSPYRHLQHFMRAQRRQGKLLALCSRNNEADVLAVFARDDMELPLGEVASHRIGWGSKATSISELATELGFALDTVIFVDDDPAECALVRDRLPDVAVVQIPRDPAAIPDTLAQAWAFDQLMVTEDDRLRADRYAQDRRRRAAQESAEDFAEFLRRCRTEVVLAPLDGASLERVAQLTVRTTQFNLTGERFSVPDMVAFLRTGYGWTVRVSDTFGDYGLVGAVLATDAEPAEEALEVRLLLVSCRVLNRGVEHEIMRYLRERAHDLGRTRLRLPYRETERNLPARLFLQGLTPDGPGPDGFVDLTL